MTKYPEQPVPGVGVVVFKENNVLVIKRRNPPRKGQWSIPGGKQKLGETWQDTAKREVREETGIEIRLIGLVDVVDAIIEDDKKNKNGKINRGPLRKKNKRRLSLHFNRLCSILGKWLAYGWQRCH